MVTTYTLLPIPYLRCDTDNCNTGDPRTARTTTTAEPSTTSLAKGCPNRLVFMASSFPESRMSCTEDQEEVETMVDAPREETVVAPGTSCIFFSSCHSDAGFIMELFCQEDHWVVTLFKASPKFSFHL